MESVQAVMGSEFFQGTTGMMNGQAGGGRVAKRRRDEEKAEGSAKSKSIPAPFHPGRDSLTKPKGNVIPAATTGPKSRMHLSSAPFPVPSNQKFVRNAQAGPSQPKPGPETVRDARKPLNTSAGAGPDYEMWAGPRYETRQSISPEKLRQATSNPHNTRAVFNQGTTLRRTDNGHHSGPIVNNSAVRNRRSVASGSASRSASPQKGKKKGPAQRPKEIDEVYEQTEVIEDPDGFNEGDRDSDVEYVPHSTAKASARSTSKSSGSASPTRPAAEQISWNRKGKAPDRRTRVDLQEWGSSNGGENETHAIQALPKTKTGIPSSNVGGDTKICKTAIVWCVCSKNNTRNMRVWKVELQDDGIILGDPRDRKLDHVFISQSNITSMQCCEREGCPLIRIDVSIRKNDMKVVGRRLRTLIVPGILDGNRAPSEEDISSLTIWVTLESTERAKAFVLRYVKVSEEIIRDKKFRLSPAECKEQRSYAPPKAPSPSDPRPRLSPSPSPPPRIAKPTRSRTNEVRVDDNPVRHHMKAIVDLYDKPKTKGKQREFQKQQELPYRSTAKDLPPVDGAAPARKSTRLSGNKSPIKHLCSDDEVIPEPPRAPVLAPPPDRGTVLFPYPLTGRASLNITKGELWRVQSGEFLNDTLIEWGLKHLIDELTGEGHDPNVHLFNSFFYTKISSKDHDKKLQRGNETEAARWPAYETVRKWTKSVDVFSKKFIIVPINEDFHWYLAVIFNPGGMLVDTSTETPIPDPAENVKADATTPITSNESPDVSDEKSVDDQLVPSAATPDDTQESIIAIPKPDEPMDVDKPGDGGPVVADESDDELDFLPRATKHRAPVAKMNDLSIESGIDKAARKRPSPPIGREINTPTLNYFTTQNQVLPSGSEPPKPEPDAEAVKPEVVKLVSKKTVPPDHVILKSQKPWVITFDSLGSQHKLVGKHLNEWLQWEARTKQGEQYGNVEVEYTHAQVPLQANFSDCGLYLVHYARRLLTEPDNILKLVERRLPHKSTEERKQFDIDMDSTWKVSRDHNLRDEWQAAIISLKEAYDRQQAKDAKSAGDEAKSEGGPGDEAVEGDSVDDVMLVAQPGLESDGAIQEDSEGGKISGLTKPENEELAKAAQAETDQVPEEATSMDPDVPDQGGNEIVAECSPRTSNSLGLDQYGSRDTSDTSPTGDAPTKDEVDELDELEDAKSELHVPRGGFSPEQIATALNAADPANDERFLGQEDDDTSIDLQTSTTDVSNPTAESESHHQRNSDEGRGELDYGDDIDPGIDDFEGPRQKNVRASGHLEDEDGMPGDSHTKVPGEPYFLSSPEKSDTRPQMILDAGLNHPLNPNAPSATSNVTIDKSNAMQHQVSPDPPDNHTHIERYQGNTRDDAIDVDDDADSQDDDGNQEDDDNHEDDDKENAPPRPDIEVVRDHHVHVGPPVEFAPAPAPAPRSSRAVGNFLNSLTPGDPAHRRNIAQNRAVPSSPLTSIASRDEEPAPHPPHSHYNNPSSGSTAKPAPPVLPSTVPPWKAEEKGNAIKANPLSKFTIPDSPSSSEGTPGKRTTRSRGSSVVLVDRYGQEDDLESRSNPDDGTYPSTRRSGQKTRGAIAAPESTRVSPAATSANGDVHSTTEDADFEATFPRTAKRAKHKYGGNHRRSLVPTRQMQVSGTSRQTQLDFGSPTSSDNSARAEPSTKTRNGKSNQKRRDEPGPENARTKKQKHEDGGPGSTPARPVRTAAKKVSYNISGKGVIEVNDSEDENGQEAK